MATCLYCGKASFLVTHSLQACGECLRSGPEGIEERIRRAHSLSRDPFSLPPSPPRDPEGVLCNICANECQVPDGGRSYCGIRWNKGGRLKGVVPNEANVDWYYDRLPTNCVADWVCPGGTGAGYPRFAYRPGAEYGYKNLAVFYQACSFDCLFCQNWHYRQRIDSRARKTAEELALCADESTSCICYFGGDPTPQLPHALKASRLARNKGRDRILRICWETNGNMHPNLLRSMVELSLESGGCIKFDLKVWNERLHHAMCGVSNQRTLENFRRVAARIKERSDPPLLVASTLLVPGYVDEEEVGNIARFLASLDPEIPYALLGFHPCFYMSDLPRTSRRHAEACLDRAMAEGLKRVRIGNLHLLSEVY